MKVTICLTSAFALMLAAAPSLYAQTGAENQVERGRYLVGITGCHDCHSPKIPGGLTPVPERILPGGPQGTKVRTGAPGEVHASEDFTAFTGGWGSTVASDLTPDPARALGRRYPEAKFVAARPRGKKPEGVAIMPPMPVDGYVNMKDDDLKAIY